MYVVFPVFIGRRCTSEGTSLDQNQLRACGGNGQARGPIDGRLFRASNNRLGLALLELVHRNEPVSGSGLLRRLGLGWSTIIDSLRKAARKREIERDRERERERERYGSLAQHHPGPSRRRPSWLSIVGLDGPIIGRETGEPAIVHQ